MIGAIIGDIVGSRFEFGAAPQQGFELFTPDCSYTDDTICTIAIADAVLNERDYQESLLDWCRRYPDPMGGYGRRFYQWINADNPQPTDSFGNGSAMRVSPIGWLFDEWEDVIEEAKKSAIVSHNHPEGIKGAQCIAEAICWLRLMRFSKSDVERKVEKFFGYEFHLCGTLRRLVLKDTLIEPVRKLYRWHCVVSWMPIALRRLSASLYYVMAIPTQRLASLVRLPKPIIQYQNR